MHAACKGGAESENLPKHTPHYAHKRCGTHAPHTHAHVHAHTPALGQDMEEMESAAVVHLSPAAVVRSEEYCDQWVRAVPLAQFRHFGARPGAGARDTGDGIGIKETPERSGDVARVSSHFGAYVRQNIR